MVLACAAALLLPGSVSGGELMQFDGVVFNGQFGFAVAPIADVNQDDVDDLLVGSKTSQSYGGSVEIRSGVDGAVLRTFEGEANDDGFGLVVTSVGDIDGRGTPDVLTGASRGGWDLAYGTYAKVFAGEDGTVLFHSGIQPARSQFGAAVACLGDLNGDGVPDFAVGRPEEPGQPGSPPGFVHVYSGSDGVELGQIAGSEDGDGFGASIAPLGDLDGDSIPDFAVGSPGHDRGGAVDAGRIDIFSGANLGPLRSIPRRGEYERFGRDLASLAGNGVPGRFLAASTYRSKGEAGRIAIFDAKTGRRIRWIKGGGRLAFGARLARLADIDGDGTDELAVFSDTVAGPTEYDNSGLVEVFSIGTGKTLFLFRGDPPDGANLTLCGAGDLNGDGVEELAVGFPTLEKVVIFEVGPDPTPGFVRVALQRETGLPDPDASGFLEFGPVLESRPLAAKVFNLDEGVVIPPYVFLEDSPGSGVFVQLGFMKIVGKEIRNWSYFGPVASWSPAASMRFASLGDYAGCRVEVRDPFGAVQFRAVLPMAGQQDFAGESVLSTPDPLAFPKARGVARVRSSARRGSLTLRVRAEGIPDGADYRAWVEDGPASGTFSEAGRLARGRLVLDSARGDVLPGCAPDGDSLSGRLLEVRDGATVVLRGTLP